MAFNEMKYRVLMGIFELAGESISGFITKPNFKDVDKVEQNYFDEARRINKEISINSEKTIKKIIQPVEEISIEEVKPDLTETKIKGGVACLPCSRDHFSTVSGALNEAIRFSRKNGISDEEVQRRIGISIDELNMLERIDLASEDTIHLRGKEKELADWALDNARDLRHKITTLRSHEDLEGVTAQASKVRTKFMQKFWEVITVDGSIQKLCKGLKEDEYTKCVSTINTVLKEKAKEN